MKLKDRFINLVKTRRNNVINGHKNSIESPFERFRDDYIGVERATYYLITAATKAGKTQISSFLFMFDPIMKAYKDRNMKYKLYYFPFEETPEKVMARFISYLLYVKHNIEVEYKTLMSAKNEPLHKDILQLIERDDFQDILEFFEECVVFVEDIRTPSEIESYVEVLASDYGSMLYQEEDVTDEWGMVKKEKVLKGYTPKDPNQYVMIYIDHISLLQPDKGLSLKEAIDELSSYFVKARNIYQFSPVVIQQQAFNEKAENMKAGLRRPTLTGLSDTKYTSRDASIVLGIYAPHRMKESNFMGYDIDKLKDHFRALEVLANRDGETGGIIGLRFRGKVSYFSEMPRPGTNELDAVYKDIENKRKRSQPKENAYSFVNFVTSIFHKQKLN